jgi:hypothetical protein
MSHKKYRTEKNCLNCGAIVERNFCGECGQENIETKESFVHLVGHFVSDYLHYDSKFRTSMKLLLTKPGFLTKAYWEGKRVQYIHPMKLYFFIVVFAVMFTSFFYSKFEGDIKKDVIKVQEEPLPMKDGKVVPLDSVQLKKREIKKEKEQQQVAKLNAGMDNFFKHIKWISFFLLPVFALVFHLLYIRRKVLYVDHLVYALHQQSFINVFGCLLLLIPLIYPPWFGIVNNLTFLLIFVYTLFSLRYLYKQSWWKTTLKSLLATFLVIFSMLLVMVGYLLVFLFKD